MKRRVAVGLPRRTHRWTCFACAALCIAACGPASPADSDVFVDGASDLADPVDGTALDGRGDGDITDAVDQLPPHDHTADDAVDDASRDVPSDAVSMDTAVDTSVDVPAADAAPREIRTVNDCDPMSPSTVDLTAATDPTIIAGLDFVFRPACVRIRAGQSLTYMVEAPGDWRAHPLRAGDLVDGGIADDPTSPIPHVDMGMEPVRVTFDRPGSHGFYCTRHYLRGHLGAVHVVR